MGLAVMLAFAPIARGAVRTWSITPILLVEAILISTWLLKVVNSGSYRFKLTALDIPLGIFTLLAIASFIVSIYKYDSLYALLMLLGYIGVYYVVAEEFDSKMRWNLGRYLIFLGTGLSFYGLLQYLGIFAHPWWVPNNFLAATYVNHNHFAGYLELVIPLAMALFLTAKPALKPKLALAVALVIMSAAFILTQSRGAWMSLSVSLLVMMIATGRDSSRRITAVLTLLVLAAAIISFVYLSRDLISARLETMAAASGEPSLASRLAIWKGALRMAADRPVFGTGIGTFMWAFPRYRPEGLNVIANFAHNDYLNIAAEMGAASLFTALWMLAAVIKSGLSKTLREPIRFGCAIGVLSLSLHGFVDFNFHIPANMLLFTVYAAFIMSGERRKKE